MMDLVLLALFWILCACLSALIGGIIFRIWFKFWGY